jgi:hypothetical protein
LLLDSSAARGVMSRVGCGTLKHISGKLLWLQQKVKEEVLKPQPVGTAVNPADLGTKSLAKARMRGLLNMCGVYDTFHDEPVGALEASELQSGRKVAKVLRGYGQQHALCQPAALGALFASLAAMATSLQGCAFDNEDLSTAVTYMFFVRPDIFLMVFLGLVVCLEWFSSSFSWFRAAPAALTVPSQSPAAPAAPPKAVAGIPPARSSKPRRQRRPRRW